MKLSKKKSLEDLAIFGGANLFPDCLHVGRPNILNPDAVIGFIRQAMNRHWLSNNGPLVRELEHRFADFLQVKHCIAVNCATLGLQLAAKALDIKGEILLPSFTFIGTAHAITWIGLRLKFCDVLPQKHTLDPDDVAANISEKTGAILGVHLWGNACEINDLQNIADKHHIPLIFDAAHAIGTTYNGKRLGGFGNISVFSLHATKAINSLEGGLVTTNDDMLADNVRLLRNYGFTGEDRVEQLGINAKMNEFSAAMGLANLERYEALHKHNIKIHQNYCQILSELDGINLYLPNKGEEHNHHYAVMAIDASSPICRDSLHRVLTAENVYVRRYFHPGCHRSPPYDKTNKSKTLPVTESLSSSLLQLPTGFQIDIEAARSLAGLIKFCIANGKEIERRIAK